jgi:hypothetical protein
MNASGDLSVWLVSLGLAAGFVAAVLIFIVLRRYALELSHWLGGKFVAVAPVPLAKSVRWAARGVKLIFCAALLCGGTALGLNVAIWHGSSFPAWNDPLFKNPLFWLTWIGVMAALLMLGVVIGVSVRYALALGMARLRKAKARRAR